MFLVEAGIRVMGMVRTCHYSVLLCSSQRDLPVAQRGYWSCCLESVFVLLFLFNEKTENSRVLTFGCFKIRRRRTEFVMDKEEQSDRMAKLKKHRKRFKACAVCPV